MSRHLSRRLSYQCLVALSAALSACAAPEAPHDASTHAHGGAEAPMKGMMMGPMAMARLNPTQGSPVQGMVMFHQHGDHLMVHARLSGLQPGAVHAFHVHEKGDCSSADGTSAGGHFNPDGQPHGPQDGPHHAGDLPALQADDQGRVDAHFMIMGPSLEPAKPGYIVGRSVIVHARPDDYASQPAGNAGPRLACGVIAAGMS